MTRYICFSTVGGHERPISASESAKIDAMHCQIRAANKVSKPAVAGDDSFQENRLPCTRKERRPNNVVILAPREIRFLLETNCLRPLVSLHVFPPRRKIPEKIISIENSFKRKHLLLRSNIGFQPEEKSL